MTLKEIKQAISEKKRVFWLEDYYEVKYDYELDYYYIECSLNGNVVGLENKSTSELTEDEEDFYYTK